MEFKYKSIEENQKMEQEEEENKNENEVCSICNKPNDLHKCISDDCVHYAHYYCVL